MSTSFPGLLFSSTVPYFRKDSTWVTHRAFLSLCKSINTVYEKCVKYKNPCWIVLFGIFFLLHPSGLDTETEAANSYDCECYKKLAWTSWPVLFTLNLFFFSYIHSPLLLENKKVRKHTILVSLWLKYVTNCL